MTPREKHLVRLGLSWGFVLGFLMSVFAVAVTVVIAGPPW